MISLRSTSKGSWGVELRKALQLLGGAMGILLLCLPLFSQGSSGRILGTVTDQSGGVISGATVTVTDTERGVSKILVTNEPGEYNAPTLVPSTYKVRVEAKGFKTVERQNIVLEVGKEIRVDLTLQPGDQVQTITITESIPLVETTNATLGGTLNNAEINDLPLNGRNYQYLLSLRPGVMLQPGGGPWTQSTNNVRPDESVWMVDGVLNVSFYDARPITGASSFITDAATILPIDAIQEFNLEENPKAEYGWKPGAVVNVGIRSGTNTLHGSAYAFGRSDAFDARNIFNPALDSKGTCLPNKDFPAVCDKTPVQLKQFGAVVGGPIKKDKIFFFAGYEGLRSNIGNAIATHVPATASTGSATDSMVDAIRALQAASVPVSPVSLALMGCPSGALTTASTCTGGLIKNAPANTTGYLSAFPNSNTSDNGVVKIDYHINSKHQLNGMMWLGHYNGSGIDHAMVNPAFGDTVSVRNWTYVANWIWTPGSRWVNELRFGYSRNTQKLDPVDQNVIADGKNYPINTGLGGFPNIYIKGFFQGGSFGSWRGRPQDNGPNPYYDVQDSVSYLLGKHAFKFGGEFAHIEADANVHDTRGRFDFRGGAAFKIPITCPTGQTPPCFNSSTPLEDFLAGKLPGGSFAPNLLVGSAVRTATWRSIAGFVQDDWRLTPKLMLNLGLRYSYVSPMKEANNLLGNFDPALGMVQQGQSSVGDTVFKPDHKNFSPRLGFAWDVTGKGTTVVRGGAGIIYSTYVATFFLQQAGQQNFRGGSLAAVPTGACQTKVAVGTPCPATYGGNITLGTVFYAPATVTWDSPPGGTGVFPAGVVSCTAGAPCAIQAVDPNLRNPYITNWNLSVTRAFTNNFSLELGYVGNHGSRLTGFRDLNQIPAGGAARPYAASFPYLSFINQMSNYARSNYHSLQATLTERVTHGLSFTSGYTYGHGLDNNSLSRFGALPQNSQNVGAEYASSDFDIRHRFTLTASYAIPGIKGFGQLLEGWKLNSIVTIATAQPWNIFDTNNNFTGSGDKSDRWDFFGNPADFKSGSSNIPYCFVYPKTGLSCKQQSGISQEVTQLPTSLYAKCTAVDDPTRPASNLGAGGCFVSGNSVMTPPDAGKFGTMGRNIFRDNGFRNWDFSVFKTFTFKERYGAQFRFEVFNLLNHPIIANPNGASNGGNSGDDASSGLGFGCGCATPDVVAGNPIIGSGGARAIQLGLKLTF
jgi:Carboxypeptidase regulatory-like domain